MQNKVAAELRKGRSYRDVARQLGLSPEAVRKRVNRMQRRAQTPDELNAAMLAKRARWIADNRPLPGERMRFAQLSACGDAA